jgi:hypothetical protein
VPGATDANELVIDVVVAEGTETIRVEATPGGLVLSNGDRRRQPLACEEAWRLAEALDARATRAADR